MNAPTPAPPYLADMDHTPDARPITTNTPNGGLTMADVLSTRIKELLGRAIEQPETRDVAEVREIAAMFLFCLASLRDEQSTGNVVR